MNKYEKRKLKANLYKHSNTIMYISIFVIVAIITTAAAANRTDKIAYIDESELSYTEKESVAIKNSKVQKVASVKNSDEEATAEKVTEQETETVPETTAVETTVAAETTTEQISAAKVKVTADTLCIRKEASQDAELIGMADMDDTYDVVSRSGEWIEINYEGTKGYINSEFTEITE